MISPKSPTLLLFALQSPQSSYLIFKLLDLVPQTLATTLSLWDNISSWQSLNGTNTFSSVFQEY